MRRTILISLVVIGLLAGCAPKPAGPRQVAVTPDDATNGPPAIRDVAAPAGSPLDALLAAAAEPTGQDRCAVALMKALDLTARKEYAEALAALAAAEQAAKDAGQNTDAIEHEIARVKESMTRAAASDATLQDIRTVLDDGRADEASRLADAALAQYGGSDAADALLKIKREADALFAAQADAGARRQNLRDEVKTDLAANNLRAAAAALEQAQDSNDPDATKQLAEIHERLTRYDDARRRAEELRHDPATFDDAVAALQEAQKAWDTPDVQRQIADYQLASQNRRDRLGVADFEVRGDVGAAGAGRTLADELLPAFQSRFDVAERGQLNQVIGELKLEAGDLNAGANQAEIGRLAKVRYLVVGSVARLGVLTVNARLVDVRSGLVVQTARITAPTVEGLLPLLPQLAAVLMMTDEQKLAYEQQITQLAGPLGPIPADGTSLPPPPDVAPNDQPPPALATFAPSPPPGEVAPQDFQNFSPPPPPGQPPAVVFDDPADAVVKLRLRHVCIELGDNLFRRGRFHDAQVQFELALDAGSDQRDIAIRLDRCRPFLPPPAVVAVAPPRSLPRLAILDLVVHGDLDVVPPGLGPWTADNLAPYFSCKYDVVDRETVCWYMNRLGLSLHDVLTNSVARRWLGRALGVRFFVFGEMHQTASFVVSAHLVDAEWGYEYGAASIHVHDPHELRLRLGDLAAETQLDPAERRHRQEQAEAAEHERNRLAQLAEAERQAALRQSQNVPLLVLEARKIGDSGDLSVSIELLGRARQLRPDSIEVSFLFDRFQERRRRQEEEENRQREWAAQQAAQAAAQQQQQALAQAAAEAQAQAAREAAARQAAQAQLLDQQRGLAAAQLQAQAQAALQQQQYDQAVQLYQSALALRQNDGLYRALAAARAQADAAARQAAAQQAAAVQRQHDQYLELARRQLAEERGKQEAKVQAERAAQEARDQAVYQRLLDAAQAAIAKEQFDSAVSSLQTARQLRRTDEVDRLLNQALAEQAKTEALKKGAAEKAELERRLAEETERRKKAEAEAAHNRELYEQALSAAQKALADRNYDLADAKYQEAGKVFHTDVVLTSLQNVKQARAAATADQAKRDAEAKKDGEFRRLSDAGMAALNAKQYDEASKLLAEADHLKPGDVNVLAALAKAQKAKADADAAAAQAVRKQGEEKRRAEALQKALGQARAALAAHDLDAAGKALAAAAELGPNDPDVKKAQQDLLTAQAAAKAAAQAATDQAARLKKQQDDYAKAMAAGRSATVKGDYAAAIASYTEALKIIPGDKASADALKAAQDTAAADAKRKMEEAKKREELNKLLSQGQAAMAAGKFENAVKSFGDAAKADPTDPTAVKGLRDATMALQSAQAAQAKAAAAEKKRQADYAGAMSAGKAAMTAKKFDDAVKAFTDAGKILPGDKAAADGVKEAQAGAADAAKKAAEAKKQADLANLMTQGQTALTGKKFDDAAKAYSAALQLQPGDPKATAGLQSAQFGQHMTAGQALAAAKKFAEAVKEYEAALTIFPDNAEAKAALKRAKSNMP
jgi:tetratricopeptide (TPR) repeat protein